MTTAGSHVYLQLIRHRHHRQVKPSLARIVTEAFAPTVLVSVFLLGSGAARDGWRGLLFGFIAAIFVALGPFLGILIAARSGKLADHHVGDRKQRLPVLIGSLGSAAIGFVVLLLLQAPRTAVVGLLSTALGMIVVGAVNAFWKLSVHNAVAAFVAVATVGSFGWAWAPLLLLPLVIGWSRVVLKDHTVAQVIAGVPAGALVAVPYILAGV